MIAHRPGELADRDFVISAWSSSFKRSHFAGLLWTDDYAAIMHDQLGKLLDRPGARTVIAYEERDPAFTYGFICGDTSTSSEPRLEVRFGRRVVVSPVVHYVYVKEPYRRTGIAKAMFEALGVDPGKAFVYTCRTAIVSRLLTAGKLRAADWDPLVARYPKDGNVPVEHRRRRS